MAVSRKTSFAQLVFNLSTVSVPVFLFQVDAGTMLYLGDCDVHLQTNENVSEPRFVFVCQLADVIRETDANETSGKLGLALPGNLVGESQFRIPKLEPDIMLSNIVPLVSVELEYHDEW